MTYVLFITTATQLILYTILSGSTFFSWLSTWPRCGRFLFHIWTVFLPTNTHFSCNVLLLYKKIIILKYICIYLNLLCYLLNESTIKCVFYLI